MVATLTPAITPDGVVSLRVGSDPLRHYLSLVAGRVEGNPLIKCGTEGRLTLVSPGRTHEQAERRLAEALVQICTVLDIPLQPFGSTLYAIPGTRRGYMPDEAYHLQNLATFRGFAEADPHPDLVIEIVVTNPAADALIDCSILGVPEV